MEERKFVCKYCNKRFPCGKSLGGHIRTHMSSDHHHHHSSAHANNNNDERRRNNNVASFGGVIKFDAVRKRKRDFLGYEDVVADDVGDVDGNGNSLIYGLRENPKKTMRFVHSKATLQFDKFCKECGKGFPSLKALCGHMACHSEKEKPTNNNNNSNRFDNYNNNHYNYNYNSNNKNSSGISEKQKLVMDSQSDTETSAPRRSKRFKTLTLTNSKNKSSSSSAVVANAATLGNGSSSVSEVEQEQEEVARSLMMLSKDNNYHYKARFALFTESSDNNSVVLEAKSKSKSPSVDAKFASAAAINNGMVKDYVSNGYGVVDKKVNKYKHRDMKKLKYDEVDYDSDNSDSGYFRYGPKKVDSDDSSEEVKPSKKGFGDYDGELRKIILSREGGRNRNTVYKKLVLDDSASRKQSYNDSLGISSKKKSKNPNGFVNDKVMKYEFLTCERDNNNNNGSDYDSAYESDENSTDTESYPAPKAQSNSKNLIAKKSSKAKKKKPKLKLKKSKEHECPICNKIFRSGQALGGHKRSHFVGGSEENTLVIRTSAPNHNHNPNLVATSVVVPCLIDLNLPAPVDE